VVWLDPPQGEALTLIELGDHHRTLGDGCADVRLVPPPADLLIGGRGADQRRVVGSKVRLALACSILSPPSPARPEGEALVGDSSARGRRADWRMPLIRTTRETPEFYVASGICAGYAFDRPVRVDLRPCTLEKSPTS
jgi:hypothetical protein